MDARNKSTMAGTSPENVTFVATSKSSAENLISRGSVEALFCNTDSCTQRTASV